MAIMIPSVISPEVKSSAEKRIFEWFETSRGTSDWIVLHSLGITNHNRVIYGEIDFLVLAPRLGVFALEVKGGRVKREGGMWHFTNKYGQTDIKPRGPFDQAKDGVFSVIDDIKKRLDPFHKHIENVLFGYGVMFPDIEYIAQGSDEEQWQVFDVKEGSDVKGFIERLSLGAKQKWETIYGPMKESKYPSISDINYIASILRGDFDYVISISTQLRNAEDQLIKLTKKQYQCLDQLDDNSRCLIQGAAGTGKTLLALEEVKKSVAKGEKVALFCFNSNLADWLNNYFSKMPDEVKPEFVGTLHKFMHYVSKKAGITLTYPNDPAMERQYYEKALPAAAAIA